MDEFPCCGDGDSFADPYASNPSLVDRLIGNSYAVVKYVACNMAKIIAVANSLQASGSTASSSAVFQAVVPSPTPVFDASQGNSFTMQLNQSVSLPTFINGLKGSTIIVFRFVQDSVGGHDVQWPVNVRNGGTVSKTPNSTSVQAFAVNSDGSLDAIGPILYS